MNNKEKLSLIKEQLKNSETNKLRKKLDEFEKSVSVGGLIPEKFNDKIGEMECQIALKSLEEYPITSFCENCEMDVGIVDTPTSNCPVCDSVVVACNMCSNYENCSGCKVGSNFKLWTGETTF